MIERLIERRWFLPCAFAVLALAVYGGSLSAQYVDWDDTYLVVRNPIIRSLTLTTLWQAFTTFDPELYIPFTFLSYQLTHAVAGDSAFATHLVNLALHTTNAVLVCGLLRRWLRADIAALCGLAFLLHPIQTEAVLWSSARKDVLSAFFFLLALASVLRPAGGRWAGIGLHLAALLSKVTAFTLPVIAAAEAALRHERAMAAAKRLWPLFGLSVTFGVIALVGKQHVASLLTPLQTVALALQSTAVTIQHLLLPADLSPIYEVHYPVGLFTVQTFGAALVCSALAAVAFAKRRHAPAVMLGVLWFLIAYAPSFLTFSKGETVMLTSDRYAYLPFVGLLLAAGALIQRHLSSRRTLAAAAIVSIALAPLSFAQARIWRDTKSLFSHVLSIDPSSVHAATNLGVFLTKHGDLAGAEQVLRDIIEQRPSAAPMIALGTVLEKRGDSAGAIRAFSGAVAVAPRDPGAHFAYADALLERGNREGAIAQLRLALDASPTHTPAMQNLGALLLERGDLEEAEALLQRALELNPYYSDAHFNYALLLSRTGRKDEAAREFIATLSAQPSLNAALAPAIEYLMAQHEASTAVTLLIAAVHDDPSNVDNGTLALATIKEILSADADNADARKLLEDLLTLGIVQRRAD